MGQYYYKIEFKDGKVKLRKYVTKKIAESVYNALSEEMLLFNVQSVKWGLMI
jgi:hypothetical protein